MDRWQPLVGEGDSSIDCREEGEYGGWEGFRKWGKNFGERRLGRITPTVASSRPGMFVMSGSFYSISLFVNTSHWFLIIRLFSSDQ